MTNNFLKAADKVIDVLGSSSNGGIFNAPFRLIRGIKNPIKTAVSSKIQSNKIAQNKMGRQYANKYTKKLNASISERQKNISKGLSNPTNMEDKIKRVMGVD